MVNIDNIIKCFPIKINRKIKENVKKEEIEKLEEIRIRTEKPIILKIGQAEKIIEYKVSREEILEILEHICENSIYSYQKQICLRIHNNKRWA